MNPPRIINTRIATRLAISALMLIVSALFMSPIAFADARTKPIDNHGVRHGHVVRHRAGKSRVRRIEAAKAAARRARELKKVGGHGSAAKPVHTAKPVHVVKPVSTVTTPSTSTTATPASALAGATTGSAGSEEPSGVAMPTGNLPGWRMVMSDDFSGNSLNTNLWSTYSGQPGGDPNGDWDPSHVVVQNGELVLKGYKDANGQFATAGVTSQNGLAQTYGKYEVRYRVDQGEGVSHALILWPQNNVWGPEIDFSEDNGSDRQSTTATLHWGTGTPAEETGETQSVNLTQWHTLGVEWTPGKVVYTLDGRPWGSLQTSNVPNIPMVLDMQTQTWCGAGQVAPNQWEQCMDATTPSEVDMDVDWVVAYAPAN